MTEISGSESFVHADVGLGTWVCLVGGIHDWQPGNTVEVSLDPARAFVFDDTGRRIVRPDRAETA